MTWTPNTDSDRVLTFDSNTIDAAGLKADLETVLDRLNTERTISANQLLLYIDATNGNIFISGYNHDTLEAFDDIGYWIELQDLLDDYDNAYDFDEIVTGSIKLALKSVVGEQVKESFQVFYQTELDDARKIE